MFAFRDRLTFGLALCLGAVCIGALCLGGRTAHAQSAPVQYLTQGGPFSFGGNLTGSNASGFEGSDAQGSRTNFPNGWFVGGERGGLGMNGFNQSAAFSNFGAVTAEGMQFGYNFKDTNNLPVTFYAGFDTLKYNNGIGGPFAGFDSQSTTLPGYRAHAGVAFQPTSNLSLSLSASFAQQSGNNDLNSSLARSADPFAFNSHN